MKQVDGEEETGVGHLKALSIAAIKYRLIDYHFYFSLKAENPFAIRDSLRKKTAVIAGSLGFDTRNSTAKELFSNRKTNVSFDFG